MKLLIALSGLTALLFSHFSVANTLILPSFFEPNLEAILDGQFGLENLQRIDDEQDQYWTVTGELNATAVAKHAGFSQNFGFIDGSDNFDSLLYVPYMDAQSGNASADIGSEIKFALGRGAVPLSGRKPIFTSDPADNAICGWGFCSPDYDHMVSWLITDGESAGDYILAWEDLRFLGDRDYNDLVVRVSGISHLAIPVPAAVWLFVSGLISLVMVSRRRT